MQCEYPQKDMTQVKRFYNNGCVESGGGELDLRVSLPQVGKVCSLLVLSIVSRRCRAGVSVREVTTDERREACIPTPNPNPDLSSLTAFVIQAVSPSEFVI
jgi:hypothetical protein